MEKRSLLGVGVCQDGPRAFDRLLDFLATNLGFGRGNEPEFHLIAPHLKHRDSDAVSDDDFFPTLPAENQHELAPP
jgi:hypothetical protein